MEDKARQKALETFPILFSERMGYDKTYLQQERRNAYEKGYHQAEKDLELTWQDIALIETISKDFIKNNTTPMTDQDYYQEVLKQFNEERRNNYDKKIINKRKSKTL